jgi:hypothetical protein
MTTVAASPARAGAAATVVLLTLASGQFLMTLDSSVMNVSIATVAKDVGTTVTGIQGAITAYTLVMAALMITGAKIGAIIGRKRAFAIGCVIYSCGSDLHRAQPPRPPLRLVVPRGGRSGADPPRDRRPRRRKLLGRAASGCIVPPARQETNTHSGAHLSASAVSPLDNR